MPLDDLANRLVLVVPCMDEPTRMDLQALGASLDGCPGVDFIFTQEGVRDPAAGPLHGLEEHCPARVRVLSVPEQSGRAEAIRAGMLIGMNQPGADYVGFWEVDLSDALARAGELADWPRHANAADIMLETHTSDRWLAILARVLLLLPAWGTPSGAQLFRVTPETRALFREPFQSPSLFHLELMVRYLKSHATTEGIYRRSMAEAGNARTRRQASLSPAPAMRDLVKLYRAYRLEKRWHALFDLITAPFMRYAGFGAVATLLHYLVLTVAVEVLSVAPTVAAMMGATMGALVNYVLNYHLTFASTRSHREAFPRFFSVAALNVLLAGGVVEAAVRVGVHYLLGQLLATLLVLVVGFLLNKCWTFAKG